MQVILSRMAWRILISLLFLAVTFAFNVARAACSYDISFGNKASFTQSATHPAIRGIPAPSTPDSAVNKFYVDEAVRKTSDMQDISNYTDPGGNLIKFRILQPTFPIRNIVNDQLPGSLLFFYMEPGQSFNGAGVPTLLLRNPSKSAIPGNGDRRAYILETNFEDDMSVAVGRQYLYEVPANMDIKPSKDRLGDKNDNVGTYGGVYMRYRNGGTYSGTWSSWFRIDAREFFTTDLFVDGSDSSFIATETVVENNQTIFNKPVAVHQPGLHLHNSEVSIRNTNTITIDGWDTMSIGNDIPSTQQLVLQKDTAVTSLRPKTNAQGGANISGGTGIYFSAPEVGFHFQSINDLDQVKIGSLTIASTRGYTTRGFSIATPVVKNTIANSLNSIKIGSDSGVIRFSGDKVSTDSLQVGSDLTINQNSLFTSVATLHLNPANSTIVATVNFGSNSLTNVSTLMAESTILSTASITPGASFLQASNFDFAQHPVTFTQTATREAKLKFSNDITMGTDLLLSASDSKYTNHSITSSASIQISASNRQLLFGNNELSVDKPLTIGKILLQKTGINSTSNASPIFIGSNHSNRTDILPVNGTAVEVSDVGKVMAGKFTLTDGKIDLSGMNQEMVFDSPIEFTNNESGHLQNINSISVGNLVIGKNASGINGIKSTSGGMVFDIKSKSGINDEKQAIFAGNARVSNVGVPSKSGDAIRLKELNDFLSKPINEVPSPQTVQACNSGSPYYFNCSNPIDMGNHRFIHVGAPSAPKDAVNVAYANEKLFSMNQSQNVWGAFRGDKFLDDSTNLLELLADNVYGKNPGGGAGSIYVYWKHKNNGFGNNSGLYEIQSKNNHINHATAGETWVVLFKACDIGMCSSTSIRDGSGRLFIPKDGLYFIKARVAVETTSRFRGSVGTEDDGKASACYLLAMQISKGSSLINGDYRTSCYGSYGYKNKLYYSAGFTYVNHLTQGVRVDFGILDYGYGANVTNTPPYFRVDPSGSVGTGRDLLNFFGASQKGAKGNSASIICLNC